MTGQPTAATEVDVSIIYCEEHPFTTADERERLFPMHLDTEQQPYELFPEEQLAQWKRHQAIKFPSANVQVPGAGQVRPMPSFVKRA